jgi:hypothetical protein
VSEYLQIMVTDATDSVQRRWEGEARADDGRET